MTTTEPLTEREQQALEQMREAQEQGQGSTLKDYAAKMGLDAHRLYELRRRLVRTPPIDTLRAEYAQRDYGGRLTMKRLGGALVILGLLVTLPAPVWLSLMNVAPSSRWWELRFILMGIGFGIVALGVLLSRLVRPGESGDEGPR